MTKCFCGRSHLWDDCVNNARPLDRYHIVRPDSEGLGCQHCCQRFMVAPDMVMIENVITWLMMLLVLSAPLPEPQQALVLYRPYIWKGEESSAGQSHV